MNGDEDEVVHIADMVSMMVHSVVNHFEFLNLLYQLQKGVSSARSDDTKSLKGAVLDWIVPAGQSLTPPLARNVKMDRGFHHERTGFLLCPAGMNWLDEEYVIFSLES